MNRAEQIEAVARRILPLIARMPELFGEESTALANAIALPQPAQAGGDVEAVARDLYANFQPGVEALDSLHDGWTTLARWHLAQLRNLDAASRQLVAVDKALGWSAAQNEDKCRHLFDDSECRGRVEAISRLHAASKANLTQLRSVAERAYDAGWKDCNWDTFRPGGAGRTPKQATDEIIAHPEANLVLCKEVACDSCNALELVRPGEAHCYGCNKTICQSCCDTFGHTEERGHSCGDPTKAQSEAKPDESTTNLVNAAWDVVDHGVGDGRLGRLEAVLERRPDAEDDVTEAKPDKVQAARDRIVKSAIKQAHRDARSYKAVGIPPSEMRGERTIYVAGEDLWSLIAAEGGDDA